MLRKSYLLLGAISVFYLFAPAQITTRQIAPVDTKAVEAQKPIPPYDSLSNSIFYDDFRKYIGQEVYVKPLSKLYPENYPGYLGFSTDMERPSNRKSYYELSGTYLQVLDVIEQSRDKFSYDKSGVYLKLKSKQGWNVYYYAGAGERDMPTRHHPLLFVGYLEKTKQLNINQKFTALKNFTEVFDINTGKPVSCNEGSEWTCVDVTLIPSEGDMFLTPVFIFRNAQAEEIAVGITDKYKGVCCEAEDFKSAAQALAEKRQKEAEEQQRIAEEKARVAEEKAQQAKDKKARELQAVQSAKNAAANAEAKKQRRENLIQKYGERYGSMIAEGKVEIGMTAAMCTDAWGKPADINRTIGAYGTHEQWVYSMKSYLYFDNGKLTSIQN